MGCVQLRFDRRRRIVVDFDLGNIPSSDDDFTPVNTPSPVKSKANKEAAFLKFQRNSMRCYFCNNNEGLLIRMFSCECMFFGHEECFVKWINRNKFNCSICKQNYYNGNVRSVNVKRAMSYDMLEMSKIYALRKYKINFLLNKQL